MENSLLLDLFFVLFAALLGGLFSRLIKLPTLIGYILAGFFLSLVLPIFGLIDPLSIVNIQSLAELGIILLLFSIGIEVSVKKLFKVGRIILFGSVAQIFLTIAFAWIFLMVFGIASKVAIVLAIGFSLSSTAIIVKLLTDKNQKGSIHGEIMLGWALIQDFCGGHLWLRVLE